MGCIGIIRAFPKLAIVLAGLAPLTGWPADPEAMQVARYSTVAPAPTAAQVNPLDALVAIVFPDQLTNVAEALHYVLRRSGYQLAPVEAGDPAMSALAKQPLPDVHRRLGPISVATALRTLTGSAWSMVLDPVNRLVSFERSPEYAAFDALRDASIAELAHDSPSVSLIETSEHAAYENQTRCHPL